MGSVNAYAVQELLCGRGCISLSLCRSVSLDSSVNLRLEKPLKFTWNCRKNKNAGCSKRSFIIGFCSMSNGRSKAQQNRGIRRGFLLSRMAVTGFFLQMRPSNSLVSSTLLADLLMLAAMFPCYFWKHPGRRKQHRSRELFSLSELIHQTVKYRNHQGECTNFISN